VRLFASCLTSCLAALVLPRAAAAQPLVLVNHVGYDVAGPKRAIVQGRKGDTVRSCDVQDAATRTRVLALDPQADSVDQPIVNASTKHAGKRSIRVGKAGGAFVYV